MFQARPPHSPDRRFGFICALMLRFKAIYIRIISCFAVRYEGTQSVSENIKEIDFCLSSTIHRLTECTAVSHSRKGAPRVDGEEVYSQSSMFIALLFYASWARRFLAAHRTAALLTKKYPAARCSRRIRFEYSRFRNRKPLRSRGPPPCLAVNRLDVFRR